MFVLGSLPLVSYLSQHLQPRSLFSVDADMETDQTHQA